MPKTTHTAKTSSLEWFARVDDHVANVATVLSTFAKVDEAWTVVSRRPNAKSDTTTSSWRSQGPFVPDLAKVCFAPRFSGGPYVKASPKPVAKPPPANAFPTLVGTVAKKVPVQDAGVWTGKHKLAN